MLFAQARKGDDAAAAAFLAFLMGTWGIVIGIVGVFVFLIWAAITIFHCLTLAKALNRCSESNRQMSPGLVWLLLIPCFHTIWFIFIVIWVPGSLQKEFQS